MERRYGPGFSPPISLVFFSDGDGQFDLEELRVCRALRPSRHHLRHRIHRADPWYRFWNARFLSWRCAPYSGCASGTWTALSNFYDVILFGPHHAKEFRSDDQRGDLLKSATPGIHGGFLARQPSAPRCRATERRSSQSDFEKPCASFCPLADVRGALPPKMTPRFGMAILLMLQLSLFIPESARRFSWE